MHLQAYKSHKTVHAARIVAFNATHDGPCSITVRDLKNERIEVPVPVAIFARYTPVPEFDYLVWYDRGTPDEYLSISPGAKFEAGYHPIADIP